MGAFKVGVWFLTLAVVWFDNLGAAAFEKVK